jgi:hypothetical protein
MGNDAERLAEALGRREGARRRSRLERIAAALGLATGDLLARSGWGGVERALAEPVPMPEPVPDLADRLAGSVPAVSPAVARLRAALATARDTHARSRELVAELDARWLGRSGPTGGGTPG